MMFRGRTTLKTNRKCFFISLAVLLLVVLGAGSAAVAQVTNASISGIVQDQSGALIPGVTITITNAETGVALNTLTNEAGAYGFPSIAPGTYSLSASLSGFKTATFKDLNVGRAQVRQDFKLEVAGVTTS